VDKDGRVTYGDAPPAGVSAAPMRRSAAPVPQAEEAASDKADKKDDAKKPLTAAEQDAAFRKRQEEAAKEREKQAKADSGAAAKRDNCSRAQEYVRTLETGRISGTDAKGERYFLDDNQIAQENAKARQDVRDWCN
jgi:hypothetical protein